jgi:hypothetical protein
VNAPTPEEVLASFTGEELQSLAERRLDAERRAGEERTADLADRYWGLALGHYRQGHQPPPWPADAPPLPRRGA